MVRPAAEYLPRIADSVRPVPCSHRRSAPGDPSRARAPPRAVHASGYQRGEFLASALHIHGDLVLGDRMDRRVQVVLRLRAQAEPCLSVVRTHQGQSAGCGAASGSPAKLGSGAAFISTIVSVTRWCFRTGALNRRLSPCWLPRPISHLHRIRQRPDPDPVGPRSPNPADFGAPAHPLRRRHGVSGATRACGCLAREDPPHGPL
jgi:hypothetical protein